MRMCFRSLVRTVWLTLHQKDNWQSIKIRPEEKVLWYPSKKASTLVKSQVQCITSLTAVGSDVHCSGYIALWVKGNLLHCTGLHCNLIHWTAAVVRIALHKGQPGLHWSACSANSISIWCKTHKISRGGHCLHLCQHSLLHFKISFK